jgi:hypothetical protein
LIGAPHGCRQAAYENRFPGPDIAD